MRFRLWVKPESLLCRGRDDGEGQLGVAEGLVPSSDGILGGRSNHEKCYFTFKHAYSFMFKTSVSLVSRAGMGPQFMANILWENERLTHRMELGVPVWRKPGSTTQDSRPPTKIVHSTDFNHPGGPVPVIRECIVSSV